MNETKDSVPEIRYTVMPDLGKKYEPEPRPSPMGEARPSEAGAAPPPPAPPPSPHSGLFRNKWFYVILILVIAASGLGYYWIATGPEKSDPGQTVSTKLPKVWLNQHFGAETCTDQTRCGDEADPDDDGLDNYREFKQGTDPTLNDTDSDGLADGDEVNIYKTDPALKFTDKRQAAVDNDYNDGHSLLNGYDPLTPGIKLTESRKQQIEADIQAYGRHEPTLTTLLDSQAPPIGSQEAKTVTVFIEGGKFVPQVTFINAGDTVIWLNKDTGQHQIASDPHPTHEYLPGLVSEILSSQETFSFKFEGTGVFGYHDHLNPLETGSIEVK